MAADGESDPENGLECNGSAVDDDAASLSEHDSDTAADSGLNLAEPPFRSLRVSNDHTRLEELGHRRFSSADRAQGPEDIDVAGLVGSRLYHDIINPLGAIGNGLELLRLAESSEPEVFDLIQQSVDAATAKLRFLGLALGTASAAQMRPGSDIDALLASYSRHGRLKVVWNLQQSVPAPLVRLVMLAVLCLETALPMGGSVTISALRGGIRLITDAQRLRDIAELWRIYEGRSRRAPIEAATVQFALAAQHAKELGYAQIVDRRETVIEITLMPLDR